MLAEQDIFGSLGRLIGKYETLGRYAPVKPSIDSNFTFSRIYSAHVQFLFRPPLLSHCFAYVFRSFPQTRNQQMPLYWTNTRPELVRDELKRVVYDIKGLNSSTKNKLSSSEAHGSI